MPHRRFVVHWLFICLATWWLAVGAQADEVASPKSSADLVTFAAWVEHGEFIGDEQLRRLFVTCGTNQLGMLVPTGLRADLSRADRVTLTAPDMSYYLTVKIKETEFRSQNSEFWIQDSGFRSRLQQQVLEHFPGAMLTEESSRKCGSARVGYVRCLARWPDRILRRGRPPQGRRGAKRLVRHVVPPPIWRTRPPQNGYLPSAGL